MKNHSNPIPSITDYDREVIYISRASTVRGGWGELIIQQQQSPKTSPMVEYYSQ